MTTQGVFERRWGEGYWMVDMDMDCSATERGWFELRAISGSVLEPDIYQSALCSGSAGGARPYSSLFHMARCGYLNLFFYGSGSCEIDLLDQPATNREHRVARSRQHNKQMDVLRSDRFRHCSMQPPLQS